MNLKTWNDLTPGNVNPDAGNALKNYTGTYRKGIKPEFDETSCVNCFLCWLFCPESAFIKEGESIAGINYDYCKGCGICANECPVKQEPKPLEMKKEIIQI